MGKSYRREYIEVPEKYWVSSCNVYYIVKEKDGETHKRNK